MVASIWTGPPDDAERVGNLHIVRKDPERQGRIVPVVMIWKGKARKPYANYRFNLALDRERYIKEQIEADEYATRVRAQRKAERASNATEMLDRIQVGTILYTSWGYEQTNVEFYQVIERPSRCYAVIRQISRETVKQTGGMSCNVRPVRDAFLEDSKPIRKRITDSGVAFESYRHAWPWDHERDASGVHCSWYA